MSSIYEQLGAENLQLLVNRFYDLVQKDDRISGLFKNDINEIKLKQVQFLTQFFGGPALYSQVYGHPRMRMRHAPHAITGEAAIAWLECMNTAVSSLDIDENLKTFVFNSFPKLAAHMVNRPPQ